METIKFIDGLKTEYSISVNAYEYSLIQLAFAVALDNGLEDKTLINDMQKLYENKPIEFNEQKFTEKIIDTIGNVMMRSYDIDKTTFEEVFKHDGDN